MIPTEHNGKKLERVHLTFEARKAFKALTSGELECSMCALSNSSIVEM